MTHYNHYNIFSPYVIGNKIGIGEVSFESLKEMSFSFAADFAEASVGKQILEKGSIITHNERTVVACCVANDSNGNKRMFVVVTPGADGEYYWVQNLDFIEVNSLVDGIDKNK